jgi:hypothetical protein
LDDRELARGRPVQVSTPLASVRDIRGYNNQGVFFEQHMLDFATSRGTNGRSPPKKTSIKWEEEQNEEQSCLLSELI